MPALSDDNRKLWLWLCTEGGTWTAEELGRHTGVDSRDCFHALHYMARRKLVAKFKPESGGNHKLRYGVTGLCRVPLGFTVAEVQA